MATIGKILSYSIVFGIFFMLYSKVVGLDVNMAKLIITSMLVGVVNSLRPKVYKWFTRNKVQK